MEDKRWHRPSLVGPVILIFAGLVLLASNLGIVRFDLWERSGVGNHASISELSGMAANNGCKGKRGKFQVVKWRNWRRRSADELQEDSDSGAGRKDCRGQ